MRQLFDEAGVYELAVRAMVDGCSSAPTIIRVDVQDDAPIPPPDHPSDKPYIPPIEPALFFTPNGDGMNDTWKIKNIEFYPHAQVEIYDRFSKRVAYFNGGFYEWDGMYNGHVLPSDDYWYLIRIMELGGYQSGHITLKR